MTQPDDRPIRWGILATGGIAHAFAHDLALQPDCEVAAVGSRSQASADAFGDEFGVPHRHASYQALVSDPDVDAVYVATPHPGHQGHCAIAGGTSWSYPDVGKCAGLDRVRTFCYQGVNGEMYAAFAERGVGLALCCDGKGNGRDEPFIEQRWLFGRQIG
jgi:hypothetical protein